MRTGHDIDFRRRGKCWCFITAILSILKLERDFVNVDRVYFGPDEHEYFGPSNVTDR